MGYNPCGVLCDPCENNHYVGCIYYQGNQKPVDLDVTLWKERAEMAERDLAAIHKLLGRGDHGPKANAMCAIDAILSLQEAYDTMKTERDNIVEKLRSIISEVDLTWKF